MVRGRCALWAVALGARGEVAELLDSRVLLAAGSVAHGEERSLLPIVPRRLLGHDIHASAPEEDGLLRADDFASLVPLEDQRDGRT